MFGEDDSESPRVPSPWSNIISSPPSPAHGPVARGALIPRLVPEAEDRNVEYKLQLLDPSPARFARLVTQLKWRLLEGGGQAYYELGVADSGALIGLPRLQLEMSLETLEMMAGEIGASVIVVKEIEVPAIIAGIGMAEEGVGVTAARNGSDNPGWASDGSRRRRRFERSSSVFTSASEDDSNASSTADYDHTLAATDTDTDDAPHLQSKNSSFSSLHSANGDALSFTAKLEISSVYKPRPMRRRPQALLGATGKRKNKKYLMPPPNNAGENRTHRRDSHSAPEADVPVETKQEAKATSRRLARDRRREEQKKKTLISRAVENGDKGFSHATDAKADAKTSQPCGQQVDQEVEDLASSLATLHASICVASASATAVVPSIELEGATINSTRGVGPEVFEMDDETVDLAEAVAKAVTCAEMEPRLIVEALVVRKMSIEEAFLDFGGF